MLPSSAEQRQASRGTQCSRSDEPSGQGALGGHVQGWPFHEKPRRCPPLVVRLHTGPLRCGHRASSPGGPTDSVAAALVRTTMNPLHLCTQCAQHCGQVHLDNRTKRDAKVNKWVHGWLQSGVNLGHPATFVQVRVPSLQLPGSSSRATVIHSSLWIELWICLQSAVDNTVDDCVHNPVRARQCGRYR